MMDKLGSVPIPLNCIKVYIEQARKLDSENPKFAFFFRLHASEIGIAKLRESPDPQSQEWLLGLINVLEEAKLAIQGNSNSEEDRINLENEAWRLLKIAEDNKSVPESEISPETRVNIAKGFHLASLHFETLTVFGPISEEIKKATLYCKVTLRDLLRTAKEELGRKKLVENNKFNDHIAGSTVELHNEPQKPREPREPPLQIQQPYEPEHANPTTQQHVWSAPPGYQNKSAEFDSIVERSTILKKAERDSKHATSAIQFDDVDSAIKHLEAALGGLNALKKKMPC